MKDNNNNSSNSRVAVVNGSRGTFQALRTRNLGAVVMDAIDQGTMTISFQVGNHSAIDTLITLRQGKPVHLFVNDWGFTLVWDDPLVDLFIPHDKLDWVTFEYLSAGEEQPE